MNFYFFTFSYFNISIFNNKSVFHRSLIHFTCQNKRVHTSHTQTLSQGIGESFFKLNTFSNVLVLFRLFLFCLSCTLRILLNHLNFAHCMDCLFVHIMLLELFSSPDQGLKRLKKLLEKIQMHLPKLAWFLYTPLGKPHQEL